MIITIKRAIFLILVLSIPLMAQSGLQSVSAPATNPTLAQLRLDLATHFMEPAPHLALAKYYCDQGNRILAFYILEDARRHRFTEKEFNPAFATFFRGDKTLDNSKPAEEALLQQYSSDPNAIQVVRQLVDIYISRQDYAKAKPLLTILIEKQPENYGHVYAMAEILHREKDDTKSQAMIREFAIKYPTSLDGYKFRSEELIDKEPAKAKSFFLRRPVNILRTGNYFFSLAPSCNKKKTYRVLKPILSKLLSYLHVHLIYKLG